MIRRRAFTGFSVMFLIVLLGSCGKHPELAENHYRAGRDFIARGETDSALVELRLAIQADAKHIQANVSYQNLMRYDLGKRDEVTAEYEARLRKHPNDPVYRYFSANLENDPERKLSM